VIRSATAYSQKDRLLSKILIQLDEMVTWLFPITGLEAGFPFPVVDL